jgi:prepilin-type N-terminal cleavage/methylation domain-containing protein
MEVEHRPRDLSGARGYTLLELLMVVGIIGLIASIAIPSLRSAVRRGHRAAVAADAKELHGAMARYYADHGEFPAPGSFEVTTLEPLGKGGYFSSGPTMIEKLWEDQLMAYVPTSSTGAVYDKYWMLFRAKREQYSYFLVAHSDDMPAWAPGWYDGAYIYDYADGVFEEINEAEVPWW